MADGRGRVRHWRYWLSQPYWRAGVALCSRATPPEHLAFLEKIGVDRITAGGDRVDLRAALEELNLGHGVTTVRVDAGGTLNGALLRAGLVDEVSLLIHPQLAGGETASSIFRAPDLPGFEGVIGLRLTHLEKLAGDVVWVRYEVNG